MWFRKKAPIFLECVGCGCLMRRARKVIEVERVPGPFDAGTTIIFYTTAASTEAYCGRCAPDYDVKEWVGPTPHYFRKEPSRKVEVTEKGKKLGGE